MLLSNFTCHQLCVLLYLLWKQKIGENLHPSVGVHVGVELDQRLGLVVGQPDGGDALELDKTDWEMRDEVASQVENSKQGKMTNLIR